MHNQMIEITINRQDEQILDCGFTKKLKIYCNVLTLIQ